MDTNKARLGKEHQCPFEQSTQVTSEQINEVQCERNPGLTRVLQLAQTQVSWLCEKGTRHTLVQTSCFDTVPIINDGQTSHTSCTFLLNKLDSPTSKLPKTVNAVMT